MSLINLGELEKVIKDIERVFKKYTLNVEEKILVIRHINARLQKQIVHQKTGDMVQSVPLGGLLKRVIKGMEDDKNLGI